MLINVPSPATSVNVFSIDFSSETNFLSRILIVHINCSACGKKDQPLHFSYMK